MEHPSDTYKTILKPSEEVLFKEKKSKFFGYAFPIEDEKNVKPLVEVLRKRHRSASHFCFAWQLGIENMSYRMNDDGEPNNSAGLPIYGQIQSFKVTNVLVVVARVFGGTKLGIGGLVSAYRTAAQMALENSIVVEKILKTRFELTFDYPTMDKIMRTIKQKQLEIVAQKMTTSCYLIIAVRKNEANAIESLFQEIHTVKVKKLMP